MVLENQLRYSPVSLEVDVIAAEGGLLLATSPFDTQGATPYYVTPQTIVDKTKKPDYQASIFLRLGVIWFDYILFYREAVKEVYYRVSLHQKKSVVIILTKKLYLYYY